MFLEDLLVLAGEQGTAGGRQRGGQPGNGLAGLRLAHDQPAAHLLQFRRQFRYAGMNECHAAVRVRQGVEDFLVINENAKHSFALSRRMVQGGVVNAARCGMTDYLVA